MSVDKVSPLPSSPVDPAGARSGGHPRAGTIAPPGATFSARAFPSAAMANVEPLSTFHDDLPVSVLAAVTLHGDGQTAAPLPAVVGATAAYGQPNGSWAKLPALIDGRLPQAEIIRLARTTFKEYAATQDMPLVHSLRAAPIVEADRLPSLNASDADHAVRTLVVASDASGNQTALDLYLARTGQNSWEAVVYQRDDASISGGFPYMSPPLSVDRLAIDPATGQILASMAGLHLPKALRLDAPRAPEAISAELIFAGAIVVATIVSGVALAINGHPVWATMAICLGAHAAIRAAQTL